MKAIFQYPTPPNTWLHDSAPDYNRIFTDYIIRPETAEPWAECTDEEKEAWEKEHPMPEEPEEQLE